MSTLTPPPASPDSDDRRDAEALEALIEEARQRARRRRRGYATLALAAIAAGVLGFYLVGDDGGTGGPPGRGQPPAGETAIGAHVADGKWRVAPGMDGGRIVAFAIDPKNPKTIFAATLEAGVFKSANGARTWRHLELAPEVGRVDAIAIAPGEPKTIYAGTGRGIFKTTNGGRSWRATSSGLLGKESPERRAHRDMEGYVYSLVVDPRNADVVYAGTWQKGLFKTEDGGRSWQRIGPSGVAVSTLAVAPETSGVVYAGTERGVLKSGDGGATWDAAGLRGRNVSALALDPKHPETVYAGTLRKGIFKTTDGGASWHSAGLEGAAISGLTVDPSDTGVAYASVWDKGVYKTEDGGRRWRSLGAGVSASAVALSPREPATVYVATRRIFDDGGGVSKSLDGGESWGPMNAGLTAGRLSALALDPRAHGSAYAAIDGRGVFKKVDGRWRAANTGLTSRGVHTLAVDPHDGAVYAGTDGAVFKSTNGGASWDVPSPYYETTGVSALVLDPETPTTVYAITADNGPSGDVEIRVFKSTDGGRRWPTSAEVQVVRVRSDGALAEAVNTPSLAIDPLNPQVVYAGGRGVVKSSDGGRTWRSSGLAGTPVLGLAVDPEKAGVLYAGTDAGVFKSTDAGASWQPLQDALDGLPTRALAIDPDDHRTVYAGTDSGVFWSTDGGHRWRQFSHLPRRPFHALAVDRSAGVLYAGAYGGGVYELELAR